MKQAQLKTYTEAVKRGDYNRLTGFPRKYDNIRMYWEDQISRHSIRPFLSDIVARKKKNKEKIRVIDFGCGSGQGFELLTKIEVSDQDFSLEGDYKWLLKEDNIDLYLGLDISQAMVDKGKENYADRPNIKFQQADLSNGLGKIKDTEAPFDMYFSSYGSLSHLTTKQLRALLQEVTEHGANGSVIVLDLLGKYSIEWPGYWVKDTSDDQMRDYSMSYLHLGLGTDKSEIEHFPIRFWSGHEIEDFIEKMNSTSKSKLKVLNKVDRSVLVGRHTVTNEYNPHVPPLRDMVNSLHRDYMRTDLNQLIIDPNVFSPHPTISPFLGELIESWNTVIRFCKQRFSKHSIPIVEIEDWSKYSSQLQFAIMTLDRVIASTSWMWVGDTRANIIEPQLGYVLRSLEYDLQKGLGCGHGFLVYLQIEK